MQDADCRVRPLGPCQRSGIDVGILALSATHEAIEDLIIRRFIVPFRQLRQAIKNDLLLGRHLRNDLIGDGLDARRIGERADLDAAGLLEEVEIEKGLTHGGADAQCAMVPEHQHASLRSKRFGRGLAFARQHDDAVKVEITDLRVDQSAVLRQGLEATLHRADSGAVQRMGMNDRVDMRRAEHDAGMQIEAGLIQLVTVVGKDFAVLVDLHEARRGDLVEGQTERVEQ